MLTHGDADRTAGGRDGEDRMPRGAPRGRADTPARGSARERSAYVFLAPGLILFSIFTVFALGSPST